MDYFTSENTGNINLRGISADQDSTLYLKIDFRDKTLWRVNHQGTHKIQCMMH
jgi:hypothetical protein